MVLIFEVPNTAGFNARPEREREEAMASSLPKDDFGEPEHEPLPDRILSGPRLRRVLAKRTERRLWMQNTVNGLVASVSACCDEDIVEVDDEVDNAAYLAECERHAREGNMVFMAATAATTERVEPGTVIRTTPPEKARSIKWGTARDCTEEEATAWAVGKMASFQERINNVHRLRILKRSIRAMRRIARVP